MPIYVDPLKPCIRSSKWRHDESCHMIADTVTELLNFAVIDLKLKASWIQNSSKPPHYDLNGSRREEAVYCGAVELDVREFVAKMQEIRSRSVQCKL